MIPEIFGIMARQIRCDQLPSDSIIPTLISCPSQFEKSGRVDMQLLQAGPGWGVTLKCGEFLHHGQAIWKRVQVMLFFSRRYVYTLGMRVRSKGCKFRIIHQKAEKAPVSVTFLHHGQTMAPGIGKSEISNPAPVVSEFNESTPYDRMGTPSWWMSSIV
jgi:hypothetical protein